jgi:drug/metabolite transporter (DMT)-like permease
MSDNRNLTRVLALLGGVLLVASASIMIRQAQRLGVSSPLIAAGRLGLAAIILTPIAIARVWPEIRRLSQSDLLLGIGSGAFLALHFSAWIRSLEYTSVASSSALVATNPLWIALASVLLFRQRLAAPTWLGVLITVAGSVLIAISDSDGAGGSNALLGDGLALLGALAGSGYFLIGAALQRRLSTLAYIWLVYSSAAVILALVALGSGRASAAAPSYPPAAYLLLLGLALGPQLLGHTAFNWSLRHLSAAFVAVVALGEPIGAALMALALFGQAFQPLQLFGFMILLVGIAIAARGERAGKETAINASELPAAR